MNPTTEKQSFVYIIKAKGRRLIKIGISSDPEKRRTELQTGSPFRLILLGIRAGGRELEKQLHLRLNAFKQSGEWFQCSGDDAIRLLIELTPISLEHKAVIILSLGQILAVSDESIGDARARETLDRHVRQIAAIIQERPFNKPDELTDEIIGKVRALIRPAESPAPAMASVV